MQTSNATPVSITKFDDFDENNRLYKTYTIGDGTKNIRVLYCCNGNEGATDYVNVKVNNAMQKVWRGMGVEFESFEQALGHYKSTRVKQALELTKQTLIADLCKQWVELVFEGHSEKSYLGDIIGKTLFNFEVLTINAEYVDEPCMLQYIYKGNEAGLFEEIQEILNVVL